MDRLGAAPPDPYSNEDGDTADSEVNDALTDKREDDNEHAAEDE